MASASHTKTYSKSAQALPQPKQFGPSDIAVAVDDSGSTGGVVFDQETTHVATPFGAYGRDRTQPLILWSCNARFFVPNQHVLPRFGGTCPQTIFDHGPCQSLVEQRPIFVLTTDGQIGTSDVQSFASVSSAALATKFLNVGVIFPGHLLPSKPGFVNISVMAPLFVGNYVILVFDPQNSSFKVVATSSHDVRRSLGRDLPEVTEDTTWQQLPTVDKINNFLTKIQFTTQPARALPLGEIRVLDTPTEIRTTTLADMQAMVQNWKAHMAEFQSWNWELMAQDARIIPGRMQELRAVLVNLDGLIRAEKIDVTQNPEHLERRQQIDKLATLLADQKFESSEHADNVRTMYRSLVKEYMAEEERNGARIKAANQSHRAFTQGVLRLFSALEQSAWTLESVTGGANRAKRASNIEFDDAEDQLRRIMTMSDVKFEQVECQICFEVKFAAIMLIPGEENKDDFYLEDFAIDCPLACGYQASKKFSNLHLCLDCALFFLQRGEDMYHRRLLGVWPVVKVDSTFSKPVIDYYRQVVKRAFLSDKDMGHGLSLMFAATECLTDYDWGRTDVWLTLRKTILDGLSRSMVVRKNMDNSDISTPNVPFIDALQFVIHNPTAFNPKPVAMQYFLIRMARHLGVLHDQIALERAAVLSEIVSRIRKLLPSELEALQREVISLCHETNHGIPIRGSFRPFLPGPMKTVDIRQLLALMIQCPTQIDASTWTEIWCRLIKWRHPLQSHSKESLMSWLAREDPYFGAVIRHDMKDKVSSIGYSLIPKFRDIDKTHSGLPRFYLNLGEFSCTDPIQCICGKEFMDAFEAKSIGAMDKIADVVRRRRNEHFAEVYGSAVPDSVSGHYNLHSTVAAVVSKADEKTDLEDAVFQKLSASAGRKGDVFRREVLPDVLAMIHEFQEFRKTESNMAGSYPPTIVRSVAFKIFCAAKKRGWISQDRKFGVNANK